MSSFRFIGNTRSRLDKSITNVMAAMILGNTNINEYDSSKTYSTDDKVFIRDASNNVVIYTAIEDNITGAFDITKWVEFTPYSTGDGGSGGGANIDNLVLISENQPDNTATKIWFKPVSYS